MRLIHQFALSTALAGYAVQAIFDNFETSNYNASKEINALKACPTARNQAYDYIVVGAGAGGGPVAARLALKGFKVLLVDSGPDHVLANTTVPLYLGRATEDPAISLDYQVDHYPPTDSRKVNMWYPRAQGLGGSVIHNALINQLPHDWDFNQISTLFNDQSWNATNMQKYFTRIENNLYIPQDIGSTINHGYDGWMYTQAPATNLVTDPKYYDPQLIDLITGIQGSVTPVPGSDFTTNYNDLAEGGGAVILTKRPDNTRSSVRDHLIATQKLKPGLKFQLNTLVTKVLSCKNADGKPRAYGITTAPGEQLPVSAVFKGKNLNMKTQDFFANNEIILAGGAFETPKLLMLSGIGHTRRLKALSIPVIVSLPGVGENLQDRIEMTMIWRTLQPFVLWNNCRFGDSASVDPCMADWISTNHTNLYQSGPATWATSYRTVNTLPYRDLWMMSGAGGFKGYYKGWSKVIAEENAGWNHVILKAHTASKGWVRLNGSHIQDVQDINKNQGQLNGFTRDIEAVKKEIIRGRSLIANTPIMAKHIKEEVWPGVNVTEPELTSFLEKNTWGHHACCTAKIGTSADKASVLTKDFQVYGIENLRVVDNSAWPNIPGMFVTTPIYMISEKAADVIAAYASSKGWAPTA